MSVRNKADSVFLPPNKKKFILSTQAARLKSPQTPVERPKVIRGGDLVVSACVHVFGCANVHVRVITKGGSEMP